MELLQRLVLKHAHDEHMYKSGALSAALSALCIPISSKYDFPITTRSTQPWKLASTTALTVLEATLPRLDELDDGASQQQTTTQDAWSAIAAIADGILRADCDGVPAAQVLEDEAFDMASFQKLRSLIIPSLGSAAVHDETRRAYAESVFRASIVHAPSPADEALLSATVGLQGRLHAPRSGRTVSVPPSPRARMAYAALDELFSLLPVAEEGSSPEAHVRIACSAAPFLLLRCALTLRAYVADQPLRGRMPQPLSQRRELEWLLRRLVTLRSEARAIPHLPGVASENRKHLLQLYPLVVKAAGVSAVADTGAVSALLNDALEVVGGELGL